MISQKSMVRCPECLETNTIKHWNESTQKIFGPASAPLEEVIGIEMKDEFWYICPACEEQLDMPDLEIEKDIVKEVKVIVTGTLHIEIIHSKEVIIEVDEDMTEDEIEEKAKAELEIEYYELISPTLEQLEEVVDEWEVKEHYEEVTIIDKEEE